MSRRSNNQRSRPIRRSDIFDNRLQPSVRFRYDYDYIKFNISASHSLTTGEIKWDEDYGTLAICMNGDEVIQPVGMETYVRVKADATINAGQVVMVTGAVGNTAKLTVNKAFGLAEDEGDYILGLATKKINTGSLGYITAFGHVEHINCTGSDYSETWSDGVVLYWNQSVAGGLTRNKPTSDPVVRIGRVIHANNNGQIFVNPSILTGGSMPILSRPPISIVDTSSFSLYSTTVSSTTTIMSIQGPGVLNYMRWQGGWSTNAMANAILHLYIDNVKVKSGTIQWNNQSDNFWIVGGYPKFDVFIDHFTRDFLCFSSSFTLFISNFSCTSNTYIKVDFGYHLVE